MLGIPFRVVVPEVDEHVLPSESPQAYVTRLARAKGEAVAGRAPGELILAADTTVVLGGEIFGKPDSPEHAVEMLFRLQSRTHEVMTAVAVARNGEVADALDVSRVTFRPADVETLRAYVETGEPLDQALVEGCGDLRRGGVHEARAPALPRIAIEGELRDHQESAAHVAQP